MDRGLVMERDGDREIEIERDEESLRKTALMGEGATAASIRLGNFTDLGCRLHLLRCERNPKSEKVRGYALTITTNTKRLEG
ncbi:hypothetical protein DY000_02001690 [Brassica cretica]|uniref:Uncharacterized protein n=1 Tax=Brassica cretica TaxID=69181 RepID=A0ABQ7BVP5_BRACR|nr:hypothetical protein DY000_02001690 [Brassica cretica]